MLIEAFSLFQCRFELAHSGELFAIDFF